MRKENVSLVVLLSLLVSLSSCTGGKKSEPADGTVFSLSRYPGGDGEAAGRKWIFFAGGCFWGVELYLSMIPGVIKTEVGYANGRTEFPTYEDVCYHNAGHAETVLVEYDSNKLELSSLLDLFYEVIDPTSLNRQGNDVGTQYRTGVYYVDETDRNIIEASISQLGKRTSGPVVIEVKRLENYYTAEEYHQKYLEKNPWGYCHISTSKFQEVAKLSRIVNPEKYSKPSGEEIRAMLTEKQYMVTQECGTELPFTGEYNDNHAPGLYVDIVTGEPLFSSTDKYDSGSGWPSFTKPIDPAVIVRYEDNSYGMIRIELRSRVGDSHLGHLFTDGPAGKGGLRYCINSMSLRFIPYGKMKEEGYGEFMPLCEG